MRIRSTLCLACQFFTLSICGDVAAQITITDPGSKGVRQVSLSTPQGIVAARRDASSRSQIRVAVQYLMVDKATRAAIFAGLESTAIENSVTVPEAVGPVDLGSIETPNASSKQITSPSRVTTSVLNDSDVSLVLKKSVESPASDVSNAPSIMLLDGKEAEMNDVVQHPFVIDVQSDGNAIKPSVHAFDDGIRLRLLAELADASPSTDSPPGAIRLTCEILSSRLLEVQSDEIFGVRDEPVAVQTPIHQLTSAIASQQLAEGQTLLVDPHVSKTRTVQSETAVPVIGKIPYVGRSFRNVDVTSVEQHMIVLLRPSIEQRKE